MLTFKTASSKSIITRLRPLCVFNEEGRVLNLTGTPNYEYSLKDHLGNSRVTFDSNGGAVAKQTDDYYPFGMIAYQPSTPSPENKYLYNGKEIQRDLNDQYDYGARLYDPIIILSAILTLMECGLNSWKVRMLGTCQMIDTMGL